MFWPISGGRTIIFTETKNAAAELSDLLHGARALHGDIQQTQREVSTPEIYFLKCTDLSIYMCKTKDF